MTHTAHQFGKTEQTSRHQQQSKRCKSPSQSHKPCGWIALEKHPTIQEQSYQRHCRMGGNEEEGEIWNGIIWHKKSVSKYAVSLAASGCLR